MRAGDTRYRVEKAAKLRKNLKHDAMTNPDDCLYNDKTLDKDRAIIKLREHVQVKTMKINCIKPKKKIIGVLQSKIETRKDSPGITYILALQPLNKNRCIGYLHDISICTRLVGKKTILDQETRVKELIIFHNFLFIKTLFFVSGGPLIFSLKTDPKIFYLGGILSSRLPDEYNYKNDKDKRRLKSFTRQDSMHVQQKKTTEIAISHVLELDFCRHIQC